jgi:HSP90 family molecular chaperone
MEIKDLSKKIKRLGLDLYKKAKNGYENAKTAAEQTILNDQLRKRFNLENPYKFVVTNEKDKATIINKYIPRHAKRYNEDDIFVFYGEDNDIAKGDVITDLSDETKYEVIQTVDVTMPVKLNDKVYDVPCVAAYGKMLS